MGRYASYAFTDVPIKEPVTVFSSVMRAKATVALFCLVSTALFASTEAGSQTIVALGASNTAGKGVGRDQAYPAQLQAMLQTQGFNGVRVINAGINGDTPTGMLQRLGSSVPEGTKLVILNPGGNDLRACRKGGGECATEEEHRAVIEKIRDRLRARGIPVVMAKFGNKPNRDRQADGRHLTPEAHRAVAAQLLPQVTAALGGRQQ